MKIEYKIDEGDRSIAIEEERVVLEVERVGRVHTRQDRARSGMASYDEVE